MSFLVDLILLAIFASMIIAGARNGFVKTVLGLASLLIALFLAVQLSGMLAPTVYKAFLDDGVYKAIHTRLIGSSDAVSTAKQAQAVIAVIPKSIMDLASSIGINSSGITKIIKELDVHSASAARELTDKVAAPIITALVHAVLFSILFFVIYSLLKVVVVLINKFFKLPVLKSANKLLGAVLGVLKGALSIFVLCVLLKIVAGLCTDTIFAQAVHSSRIVSLVANNNFILDIFHI